MERSEFVFDYAQLLYYKCQKRNPNRDESYIDFPYWMKNGEGEIASQRYPQPFWRQGSNSKFPETSI